MNIYREFKENQRIYGIKLIFRIVTLVATVAASVLFCILLTKYFDPQRLLYSQDVQLDKALNLLVILFCASFFVASLVFLKQEKKVLSDRQNAWFSWDSYIHEPFEVKLCRYICAIVLVFEAIYRFIAICSGEIPLYVNIYFTVLTFLFLFVFILYFVPEIYEKITPNPGNARLLLGTIGIAWFLLSIFGSYFDMSVALSSPYKTYSHIVMLVLMLYFVYEIKLSTKQPSDRTHFTFLCIAFFICVSFTVGRAFMLLSGNNVSEEFIYYFACDSVFSLYLAFKMIYYSDRV